MAEAEVFPAATSKEKDGDSFLDLWVPSLWLFS
jgi:hypothetical protein